MGSYRFYTDIPVRYGDLDPQGHMNNTRYFTFLEQARLEYVIALGLWNGQSFLDLGLIVADAHIAFLAPVMLNQTIRVWARVTRLGNKSLSLEYEMADRESGKVCARGDTVMVTYDYHQDCAIPVPDAWREAIAAYEGIPARA